MEESLKVKGAIVTAAAFISVLSSSYVFAGEQIDRPVAKVLGQVVKLSDISPNPIFLENQRKALSPAEFVKWEKDYKMQVLEGKIFSACSEKFLSDMKMEPTEKEIDSYIAFMATKSEAPQESMRRLAPIFVGKWKFEKALYKKYGGRVIFQQAGNEPLDAHQQFLQEIKGNHSYEIIDPEYVNVFSRMEEYFSMPHTFLKKEDVDKYFARPWWEEQ